MRQVKRIGYGCAAAAAMAAVGQLQAGVAGPFTENTNYATPGRAPGAPADTDHAPYGWLGYNGAKTWELYRKYEPNSFQDETGEQLGVSITNDPAQAAHAVVHNETSNYSNGGAWNGPGLWIGPNGLNQFPTNTQILVSNPVIAPDPQNMEIRMGFVTTANLADFIYNPGAGVGSASDGGDGRSSAQNGGTRRTSHSDFYAGFNPGPGADTYYLHVAVDPSGNISGTNAYGRSGNNTNNESGDTAIVNPDDMTTLVKESGNVGPGPYAISAKLVRNPASPTGWSFQERVGGYSATFDLPDLNADPSGVPFRSTFDPTKVTPVIYAQMAGGNDYADADVYATTPGDINLDGKVNFSDLLALAQNYGKTDVGWIGGDLDGNGKVDFGDLLTLAQNYGTGNAGPQVGNVPEPAAVGLVALGIACTFTRRKRQT